MLPAPRAPAGPVRHPLLKAAAALFRQGAAAVVYGYLAMVWAHSLCGGAVEIVGRWTYGEGSAAEAIGAAVRAACWPLLVRLFPVFFPLILVLAHERAEYERKEEEREVWRGKLASNEQLLKRNRGEIRLPKGINLAPLYMTGPLFQLLHLALLMKRTEGDVSLMRMGSLLCDVAYFGLAISTGFMVQNVMIFVTVPKLRDGDDVMQ